MPFAFLHVKKIQFMEDERQTFGHKFDNMIKACTFKQRDCLDSRYIVLAVVVASFSKTFLGNCRQFLKSNYPSYGNCFTFNSAINDEDDHGGNRATSMAGPNFGLDLVIDLEQAKYMKNGATQSAGARVVVQSSSAHPQPDEMGHHLNPNTHTALAMYEVISFP